MASAASIMMATNTRTAPFGAMRRMASTGPRGSIENSRSGDPACSPQAQPSRCSYLPSSRPSALWPRHSQEPGPRPAPPEGGELLAAGDLRSLEVEVKAGGNHRIIPQDNPNDDCHRMSLKLQTRGAPVHLEAQVIVFDAQRGLVPGSSELGHLSSRFAPTCFRLIGDEA